MQIKSRVHDVTKLSSQQKRLVLIIVMLAFILGSAAVIIPGNLIARASTTASITVTPKSVAYSNQRSITVNGINYTANEIVKIYWNYNGVGTGTLETQVTASASGSFTARFKIPLVTTGTYTIAAVGQTSGSVATGTAQILPQMYFSPRASGALTKVYFFGNAFGANEQVIVYWNYTGPGTGTPLATATTDTIGSFKVTANIPTGTPAGTIPVVAIGQTSHASGSFGFILYPSLLTLAPLSGAPGTPLTVSAYGFAAFEKVNVYWNNGLTPVTSASTTQNGYIAPLTITVPVGTVPGNYTVKVKGTKSLTIITNTFSVVAPSSNISAISGPVGAKVTITGNGYAPGETVNIQWNYTTPGTGTTVATATAGFAGTFTASFLVPTNTPGNHTVAAVGASSQIVTHQTFTLSNSLAVDPATTSPGVSITITGGGFQAGEIVQIHLNTISGVQLAAPTADSNGNINTSVQLPISIIPGANTLIGAGQTSGHSFSTPLTIDTSWGDFGLDTAHHRYNANEYSVGISNVSQLVSKWTVSTAINLRSSPVYANGIVYMGTHDGQLIAYNANTGTVKWQFNSNTGFEVPSAPLVDPTNNLVFFGTMGYEDSGIPSPFYALNAQTGQLVWSEILPWNNFGFPTLAFNTIYIGASHEGSTGMLNAIDELSGHLLWQHATNGGVWGAVAADTSTGAVFTGVGNPGNQVLSLNALTDALNWSYSVPNSPGDDDMGSGIAVANGLVFANSKNGSLYAINENNGTLKWTTLIGTTNNGNVSSPTIGPDGTLYVGSLDGNLYAINSSTGAVLWKALVGGGIDSSPAIANGVVYFTSFNQNIYAVNASTGAILWHYSMIKLSYTSPIIVNGWLYSASTSGRVYAFSL